MSVVNHCWGLFALAVLSACQSHSMEAVPVVTPAATPMPSAAPSVKTASAPAIAPSSSAPAKPAGALELASPEAFPLPGATAPVSLDFIFYEADPKRVWIPAGGTGSVGVFDPATRRFERVVGFKTVERENHGKKRVVGPSAGAVGEGFSYIGNRASSEICSVDRRTLHQASCLKLSAAPDCVEYVPSTHEVWVTTPSAQSIVVLDAAAGGTLKQKSLIKIDGEPEGYALDEAHGSFLTNLEDKGSTLSIDLHTHAVKETWQAGCAADGPRGVAVDSARSLVFVACTDHVQVLDAGHGGTRLGSLDTGAGLDNIEYAPETGLLYAAAGKAARLTIARVTASGELEPVATGATSAGARNAVADESGNVYVAESAGARLLVFRTPELKGSP